MIIQTTMEIYILLSRNERVSSIILFIEMIKNLPNIGNDAAFSQSKKKNIYGMLSTQTVEPSKEKLSVTKETWFGSKPQEVIAIPGTKELDSDSKSITCNP